MTTTHDTRVAKVRYGRAYCSDEQWAAQEAELQAEASGQNVYGAAYLAGVVKEPDVIALPAEVVPPEPPQMTIRELQAAMGPGVATEASFRQALGAEVHRTAGPRKVAMVTLAAAAVRLGLETEATELQAWVENAKGVE